MATGYDFSSKMPLPPFGGFQDEEHERLYRELCKCAKAHEDAEKKFSEYSPTTTYTPPMPGTYLVKNNGPSIVHFSNGKILLPGESCHIDQNVTVKTQSGDNVSVVLVTRYD